MISLTSGGDTGGNIKHQGGRDLSGDLSICCCLTAAAMTIQSGAKVADVGTTGHNKELARSAEIQGIGSSESWNILFELIA